MNNDKETNKYEVQPKHMYLVSWDNQLEYDDHDTAYVCVCDTERKAQEAIVAINKWYKETIEGLVEKPERDNLIERTECPFGCENFKYDLLEEQKPLLDICPIAVFE